MNINDFLGNTILKETFSSFFKNNKVPHFIILEGEKGLGKKTFSKIIAQNVLCNFSDPFSCENCKDCKKIINDIHPDVIYPEKTGTLNTFSVSTVREIRKDAYIVPNEADYKVYIFLDADDMNAASQNALLKVIEEPPSHVIFIFTCVSSKNFLNTIKSRAQIFKMEPVSELDSIAFLKSKFHNIDDLTLKKTFEIYSGNIGKVIEFLESGQNEEYFLAQEIVKTLLVPNEAELLKVTSKIKNDRHFFKLVLKFLFEILSKNLNFSLKNDLQDNLDSDFFKLKLSSEKIVNLLNITNKINDLVNRNVNHNLLLTYMTSNFYNVVFLGETFS